MFRRSIPVLLILATVAFATPALAKSHVIAAKTAFKHGNQVYISHGLTPGHTYQVVVTAKGHHQFTAQMLEQYTYMSNGHLGDGTKTFHASGKTTGTIKVPAPSVSNMNSWQLVAWVSLKSGKNLAVRYVQVK